MMDIERVQRETEPLLSGGNVVLAVRHCVTLINGASWLEKRFFLDFLRAALVHHGPSLWPEERASVGQLVKEIKLEVDLAPEIEVLARIIAAASTDPGDNLGIGEAMVLLAGVGQVWGQTFGAAQLLAVKSRASVGSISLTYAAQGEILAGAFQLGVRAAVDFLRRSGLGTLDNAIYLDSHSFEGNFPFMTAALDGPSLALAASVAALSSLLQIPVPRRIGFSGKMDFHGRLLQVGDVPAKLEAARDKGIQRVFLPKANRADVPSEFCDGVSLVDNLDAVVSQVFDVDAVKGGIQRLAGTRLPQSLRERNWRKPGKQEASERWLFTGVGARDPFGSLRALAGEEVPPGGGVLEDGPVLAACRAIRPTKVFLFFTVSVPGNDFRDQARRVAEVLGRDRRECEVELVALEEVSDPTDYMQLVPAFETKVTRILNERLKESLGGVALYVNLSPGTNQMETTWHLLVESGLLPAQRLQVRESRWLREGEPRVRLADPPPLVLASDGSHGSRP